MDRGGDGRKGGADGRKRCIRERHCALAVFTVSHAGEVGETYPAHCRVYRTAYLMPDACVLMQYFEAKFARNVIILGAVVD